MTVSLATQIGTIQGIIATKRFHAKGSGRDAYFAQTELRSLEATESVLAFLINHSEEFKAFLAETNGREAGKED